MKLLALSLVVLTTSPAVAQQGGYLPSGSFDLLRVLPPPPALRSVRDNAERAEFKATRKLKDSPRWDLATNDVKLAPADLLDDFACPLGVTLTPATAPRTMALIARATADIFPEIGRAKKFYDRPRPFLRDQGPVCQPPGELKGSADYPSGHAAAGSTWATLLAAAAPDRGALIMARGRAFGDSRLVCGVHTRGAVEGGQLGAAAILATIAGTPQFQRDLAAARSEIEAARAVPSAALPTDCAKQEALIAQPLQ